MPKYVDVERIDWRLIIPTNVTIAEENMIHLAKKLVERQPTADVVEVVRCKDCIYYHPSYCEVWSKFGTAQTREHGFCYMGERREDGKIH